MLQSSNRELRSRVQLRILERSANPNAVAGRHGPTHCEIIPNPIILELLVNQLKLLNLAVGLFPSPLRSSCLPN